MARYAYGKWQPGDKVTTNSRRFLHRGRADGNTVCGANPHYYGRSALRKVDDDEAATMHKCKRCFPDNWA